MSFEPQEIHLNDPEVNNWIALTNNMTCKDCVYLESTVKSINHTVIGCANKKMPFHDFYFFEKETQEWGCSLFQRKKIVLIPVKINKEFNEGC